MRARAAAQPLRFLFAIQAHAVKLPLQRTLFGRNEEDLMRLFVHSRHLGHFPIALGDLRRALVVQRAKVKVMVAVPLAAPQELLSLIEEAEVVVHVYPIGIALGQEHARDARAHIRQAQIQTVLDAIQPLVGQRAAVGRPIDSRQQVVARFADIHPARGAALHRHHSQPDIRIGRARLRKALRLGEGAP
jgi:hypothetical protein